MINEILVREGLVDVKHYEPNVRYDDYYARTPRKKNSAASGQHHDSK